MCINWNCVPGTTDTWRVYTSNFRYHYGDILMTWKRETHVTHFPGFETSMEKSSIPFAELLFSSSVPRIRSKNRQTIRTESVGHFLCVFVPRTTPSCPDDDNIVVCEAAGMRNGFVSRILPVGSWNPVGQGGRAGLQDKKVVKKSFPHVYVFGCGWRFFGRQNTKTKLWNVCAWSSFPSQIQRPSSGEMRWSVVKQHMHPDVLKCVQRGVRTTARQCSTSRRLGWRWVGNWLENISPVTRGASSICDLRPW